MARKDLLKGLMGQPAPASQPSSDLPAAPTPAPAPRSVKGAVGAVSQSIAELKSRAIVEIGTDLIDQAGLADRMDEDAKGIAALARSIQCYGQQVPVLLRPSPKAEGRYDIVYGRRRVAALRLVGLPVKAMIRDLKDRDLVLAQGQENAARKDLSFIEKANFARQMRDSGFERALICDALSVDKTVISRMLSVIDGIPIDLITAIGSAPSAGRNRWLELVELLSGETPPNLSDLIAAARGETSDDRFEAVLRVARRPSSPAAVPKRRAAPAEPLIGKGGQRLGEITKQDGRSQLTLSHDAAPGFDDWLVGQIAQLHAKYLAERG